MIEKAMVAMSGDGSYRDILYGSVRDGSEGEGTLAKPCTVLGCGGTMRFKPALNEVGAPHTLEWPWRATWVCEANPAHIEIATPAEEKALSGRSRWG